MPVTQGMELDGYHTLEYIVAPLADELTRCFWVVSSQGGPMTVDYLVSGWDPATDSYPLMDSLEWQIPAFENTGICGFRPGTVPVLLNALKIDEWSYYYAIDAPQEEALVRAGVIGKHIGDFSESFLRHLDRDADLLICHVDGWWEFYCGRSDWQRRLRLAWPEIVEFPVGRDPSRSRRA